MHSNAKMGKSAMNILWWSAQIVHLSEKCLAEVQKLPKDSFIDFLLTESSHNELTLSSVRSLLFNKAKLIDGCPAKELIKRRKTRVGLSLEMKLANDCYKFSLFLHGGSKEEISDIFVNDKIINNDTMSSQSGENEEARLCSSQPVGTKDNTATVANVIADVLALRNELNEHKIENAKNVEKFTKMIKEMKTDHTNQINKLKKQIDSCIQANTKQRAFVNEKIKDCEITTVSLRDQLSAVFDAVKVIETQNCTLTKEVKGSYDIHKTTDLSLKKIEKTIEKSNNKIKSVSENFGDICGKVEYIDRTIDKLNSPRDHEHSCLKGELKVYKQKIHDIKEDCSNNASQCNSLKTSVTQLRVRIGTFDKHLSDLKGNLLTKEEFDFSKEQYNLLHAKINSLTCDDVLKSQICSDPSTHRQQDDTSADLQQPPSEERQQGTHHPHNKSGTSTPRIPRESYQANQVQRRNQLSNNDQRPNRSPPSQQKQTHVDAAHNASPTPKKSLSSFNRGITQALFRIARSTNTKTTMKTTTIRKVKTSNTEVLFQRIMTGHPQHTIISGISVHRSRLT